MKFLYENLLRTYMTLANDIFGNNQIENPSVQDAMYEVLNSNKFMTMYQDDVPLAKKHYEEMRQKKLLEIKNKSSYNSNNIKIEVEQNRIKKIYYSKEKAKTEENEGSIDAKRNEELMNKYRQYKSMNRDLILQKKNRYINSVERSFDLNEKDNNINEIKEVNTYGSSRNKKEGNYTYNKTEINNRYSKPIESKYEISEIKYIKDKSITPINLNTMKYTKDTDIIVDNNQKNKNLGYKKTYIKEENIQENNNKYIPSYSYKKIEGEKYTKEETKPNLSYTNNTKVVSSYYSSKIADKNKNNRIEEKNKDKSIEKKYDNIIEIKTNTSSGKDRKNITVTKSYKK